VGFAKRCRRYPRQVAERSRTPDFGESITAEFNRGPLTHADADAGGRYVPTARRSPIVGYGLIGGAFGAGVVGVTALDRSLGRPRERSSVLDLAILGVATFKAARIVSRERVGSVVRAPFVEGEPASPDAGPTGDGLRRAIGELVTCTRCVGTWAALALVGARSVAPRAGGLLIMTLAIGGANDFLQAGFTILCKAADERRR
jgi:hypothetical protein